MGHRARQALNVFWGCALFIVIGLFYHGFIYEVRYRRVPVLDVVQSPGHDANERLVIIDLGDRTYPLRTTDRLIWVQPGERTCIAEQKLISRRWLKYQLAFPFYCRNARKP